MQNKRQVKFGRQLQRDLSEIFQKNPSYFFGDSIGTITNVSVSPDLGCAKIHMSILPFQRAGAIFSHLETIRSEVRYKLGKKIGSHVRIVPELTFLHDDTNEKACKMDSLINAFNIPPASEKNVE